ncbi:MAG TPA: BBE domain-containing protein, partial [Thermomicrobiales bacterium]|nr:BBE domain-containing protein [Thermomicrobiales bacterium]
EDLDASAADALLGQMGAGVESPLLALEIRDYRRTTVEEGDTGAGSRFGLSMFAIGPVMSDEGKAALGDALSRLREAMQPYATEEVLLNFVGEGDVGADRTKAAYPDADFARLQKIKRRYDPQNRFRFNHNIAPE